MVRKFKVKLNGKEYLVEVEELTTGNQPKKIQESRELFEDKKTQSPVSLEEKQEFNKDKVIEERESKEGSKSIVSPMSGIILKIFVSPGQKINAGDKLLVLEAMKMENEIKSDVSGVVKSILVKEGDSVETGQALVELE
ncbi:MAG: biotin/lipoyl-binding protein [Thermosipho sp. (in: Bacteria)]|nr:biotin/lipoyl-binding protein [Thermosipho sp. (in: thermotogales)]